MNQHKRNESQIWQGQSEFVRQYLQEKDTRVGICSKGEVKVIWGKLYNLARLMIHTSNVYSIVEPNIGMTHVNAINIIFPSYPSKLKCKLVKHYCNISLTCTQWYAPQTRTWTFAIAFTCVDASAMQKKCVALVDISSTQPITELVETILIYLPLIRGKVYTSRHMLQCESP